MVNKNYINNFCKVYLSSQKFVGGEGWFTSACLVTATSALEHQKFKHIEWQNWFTGEKSVEWTKEINNKKKKKLKSLCWYSGPISLIFEKCSLNKQKKSSFYKMVINNQQTFKSYEWFLCQDFYCLLNRHDHSEL